MQRVNHYVMHVVCVLVGNSTLLVAKVWCDVVTLKVLGVGVLLAGWFNS
jgi:hypothetical protein